MMIILPFLPFIMASLALHQNNTGLSHRKEWSKSNGTKQMERSQSNGKRLNGESTFLNATRTDVDVLKLLSKTLKSNKSAASMERSSEKSSQKRHITERGEEVAKLNSILAGQRGIVETQQETLDAISKLHGVHSSSSQQEETEQFQNFNPLQQDESRNLNLETSEKSTNHVAEDEAELGLHEVQKIRTNAKELKEIFNKMLSHLLGRKQTASSAEDLENIEKYMKKIKAAKKKVNAIIGKQKERNEEVNRRPIVVVDPIFQEDSDGEPEDDLDEVPDTTDHNEDERKVNQKPIIDVDPIIPEDLNGETEDDLEDIREETEDPAVVVNPIHPEDSNGETADDLPEIQDLNKAQQLIREAEKDIRTNSKMVNAVILSRNDASDRNPIDKIATKSRKSSTRGLNRTANDEKHLQNMINYMNKIFKEKQQTENMDKKTLKNILHNLKELHRVRNDGMIYSKSPPLKSDDSGIVHWVDETDDQTEAKNIYIPNAENATEAPIESDADENDEPTKPTPQLLSDLENQANGLKDEPDKLEPESPGDDAESKQKKILETTKKLEDAIVQPKANKKAKPGVKELIKLEEQLFPDLAPEEKTLARVMVMAGSDLRKADELKAVYGADSQGRMEIGTPARARLLIIVGCLAVILARL